MSLKKLLALTILLFIHWYELESRNSGVIMPPEPPQEVPEPPQEVIISNSIFSKFEMYLDFTNNNYLLFISDMPVEEVANLSIFFF
jgi:hypothetical protein